MDLKKINSGKICDMSTVDLWGKEDPPTKNEREKELRIDDDIILSWPKMNNILTRENLNMLLQSV